MFVFGLIKRLPTGGGFISNKLLSNGYVARYNTKADFFFNRRREIAEFGNAFKGTPKLHVILGPPSTGKTALVRQITTKDKFFRPFFIDCRAGQFDTPANVYDSIRSEFKDFFRDFKEFLSKNFGAKFTVAYQDIEAALQLGSNNNVREITSVDVRNLLRGIKNCLPIWSFWNGYDLPAPILIIDEANMFSQLGNSDPDLLRSILSWMVLNTKQEKRFHVVLTSSDSFFFNWIENELIAPHATPYVVGDLSKEEAEEYFEKHILPYYECKELEGKFDQVRRITGTRMMIIDMYVDEYKNSGGKLTDKKFSVSESEYIRLKRGLNPKILKVKSKQEPPLWETDDFVKTMVALVKAEDQGYILEDDLGKAIDATKIDSLIRYNFLHRRPTSRFAFDIDVPPLKAVLTAMNQPSICAMKDILAES